MEGFIWETAEELDMKLAQRVRNIRKWRSISQVLASGDFNHPEPLRIDQF